VPRWIQWLLDVIKGREAARGSATTDRGQSPEVAVPDIDGSQRQAGSVAAEREEMIVPELPVPPPERFDLFESGGGLAAPVAGAMGAGSAASAADGPSLEAADHDAQLLDALSVTLDYLFSASQEPDASREEIRLAKAAVARLERSFQILGVETLHATGAFDPGTQDALGTVSTTGEDKKGWIHSTVKLGLRRQGGKLIRRQGVIVFR
jgi:hypothetical protein